MSPSQKISIVCTSILAIIIGSLFFVINTAFAGPAFDGEGTSESPYEITSCEQLQQMQYYLDAYFILGNDIDCSLTNPGHNDFDPDGIWGDETGFQPIGTNMDPFTGTLNGNNRTISNLFIDLSETDLGGYYIHEFVGMFGFTQAAHISNITLQNFSVSGGDFVGGLAGEAGGETVISNLHIDNSSIQGGMEIGGLVGLLIDDSLIQNSSSSAHVAGRFRVGGLAGMLEDGATVTHSSSTATVTGLTTGVDNLGGLVGDTTVGNISYSSFQGNLDVSDIDSVGVGGIAGHAVVSNIHHVSVHGNISGTEEVGGLFGLLAFSVVDNAYMQGTVTATEGMVGGFAGIAGIDLTLSNSYAHADVIGSEVVGGFIGILIDSIDAGEELFEGPVNITNSYALGTVSSTQEDPEHIGGFIGFADGEDITIISSYWNTETSGQSTSAGGTGRTTAQMQNITTYDGWNIQASTNQDLQYPTLAWQLGKSNPIWLIYQAPVRRTSGSRAPQSVLQELGITINPTPESPTTTTTTTTIQSLLAQIEQLKTLLAQLTNNTPSPQTLVCTPLLRIGSRGENVRMLQSMLNITADGIYGPQTANTVRTFQQENNLTVDGIAGNQTCSVLSQTQNQ